MKRAATIAQSERLVNMDAGTRGQYPVGFQVIFFDPNRTSVLW